MEVLVLASNNSHKLKEMNSLMGSSFLFKALSEIGCQEDLPETQATLEGNATQKARYVFDRYQVSCFADDTGLEVEALHGEPGVYSARYAGPDKNDERNIALLLQKLKGKTNRKAQFRTIIALQRPSGLTIFEGVVKGEITHQPKGNSGFGYDPVFLPLGYDKTFAQMTMEDKNSISHRAMAIARLVDYLKHEY